jgi:hypothetical protein
MVADAISQNFYLDYHGSGNAYPFAAFIDKGKQDVIIGELILEDEIK